MCAGSGSGTGRNPFEFRFKLFPLRTKKVSQQTVKSLHKVNDLIAHLNAGG